MARAVELAARRAGDAPRPTPGWAASWWRRRATAPVFEGATAPPGRPPRRGRRAGRRPGGRGGRGRHPLHDPRALRPPRADAAVRRRHHRAPGSPGWWSASSTPTPRSAGRGIAAARGGRDRGDRRRAAPTRSTEQLAPYLKHRRTGRPWVVLKLAATLDGRTAAPDGSSRWITGEDARGDVHRLRARSDAVLVGAGTVRADDPELTARLDPPAPARQPLRVVLGQAPDRGPGAPGARALGRPRGVLDDLGGAGRPPGAGRGGRPGGPRLPRGRPGRPLRPLPGAGPVRRRRRPPALRRPGAPDASTSSGGAGWSRSSGSATTCGWRWRPDGLLERAGGDRRPSRAGGMVVVVDDEDRENEGDLVMAAESATPENIAFFLAHTSGVICVPAPARAGRRARPAAHGERQHRGPAHGLHGQRGRPARHDDRHLGRRPGGHHRRPDRPGRPGPPTSTGPGHIFPLRYRPGGVLKRAGHTEATVDLARAAGLTPAGVLCEIVTEDKSGDGPPARAGALRQARTTCRSSRSPT